MDDRQGTTDAEGWTESGAREGGGPGHTGSIADGLVGLADHIAYPLLVVDAHRVVQFANEAAKCRMKRGAPLFMADGRIVAAEPESQAALARDIASAASGSRAYRTFQDGAGELGVAFLPLCSDGLRSTASVAMVLERSGTGDRLMLYFFARSHGLTDREEALVAELSDGATVEEAAATLGMRVNTARTHVRRILHKTGCANLRALTVRLACLPPLAARASSCFFDTSRRR